MKHKRNNTDTALDRLERQIISEESAQINKVKRQLFLQDMQRTCDEIIYFKRR